MENKKQKVNVYVDGFNLYHAIKELRVPKLKWLDLRSLSEKFINPKSESIGRIYYFSAFAYHLKDKELIARHKAYIEALKTVDVDFIEGNFKIKKTGICKNIRNAYRIPSNEKNFAHEEKETDVNIAIYIVRDALRIAFNRALVITNDTDICPAIRMAKKENPELLIQVLTPPPKNIHDDLRNSTGQPYTIRVTKSKIENSLFPDKITKPNKKIITIPNKWNR